MRTSSEPIATRSVQPKQAPARRWREFRFRYWRLRLDNDWTLPAVEMGDPANPNVTLLIGDQGRAALAPEARRLVKQEAAG